MDGFDNDTTPRKSQRSTSRVKRQGDFLTHPCHDASCRLLFSSLEDILNGFVAGHIHDRVVARREHACCNVPPLRTKTTGGRRPCLPQRFFASLLCRIHRTQRIMCLDCPRQNRTEPQNSSFSIGIGQYIAVAQPVHEGSHVNPLFSTCTYHLCNTTPGVAYVQATAADCGGSTSG